VLFRSPRGQYGAGTVKVWDKGTFRLIERESNHIGFLLDGRKLKGKYNLVKTKGFGGQKNSWLIFKS